MMGNMLRIKNWPRFQHYKHRRPPWIRLYHDLLDDYDFQSLPLASKALAPMLWLLASETLDGTIPLDATRIAFRLHLSVNELSDGLRPLIDKGFIETCGNASNTLAECAQSATTEYRVQSTEKEKSYARKRASFVAPTLKEVTVYCQGRGNQVDPQAWLNYYEANGFKIGRNPMRDWRAAIRTWERNGITAREGSNGKSRPSDSQFVTPAPERTPCPFGECDGSEWYVDRQTRFLTKCKCSEQRKQPETLSFTAVHASSGDV